MGTKITLTPDAIDRLLQSDPETALEIKQGIAIEFAKRYLKDLLDEDLKIKINKISLEAVSAFREEYLVRRNNRYELLDTFRSQMKSHMENCLQEDIRILCASMYNQVAGMLNDKIKKTMTELEDNIDSEIIDRIADLAAEKAYQKLKDRLATKL